MVWLPSTRLILQIRYEQKETFYKMQIKIFNLRFSDRIDGFDDEPVRDFLADKEIISLKEYFFIRKGVPFLTVIATYKAGDETKMPAKVQGRESDDFEPRKILDDSQMKIYNSLVEWRNETAKKGGHPPFIMFSNQQVADIVMKDPKTENDLSSIKGVGNVKIAKYGKKVLEIVRKHRGKSAASKQGTLWEDPEKK